VKQPVCISLALVLIVGFLASCGDGENSTPSPTTSSTPSAAVPSTRNEAGTREQHGGKGSNSSQSNSDSSSKTQLNGEASIENFGHEAMGAARSAMLSSFTGYLNAVADGDYAKACELLALRARSSVIRLARRQGDCAKALPRLLVPVERKISGRQAEGQVRKVRTEGDRGFVVFHAPEAKLYQMTMVREGGIWRSTTVVTSILVPNLD
jgi:hypothetical protein